MGTLICYMGRKPQRLESGNLLQATDFYDDKPIEDHANTIAKGADMVCK